MITSKQVEILRAAADKAIAASVEAESQHEARVGEDAAAQTEASVRAVEAAERRASLMAGRARVATGTLAKAQEELAATERAADIAKWETAHALCSPEALFDDAASVLDTAVKIAATLPGLSDAFENAIARANERCAVARQLANGLKLSAISIPHITPENLGAELQRRIRALEVPEHPMPGPSFWAKVICNNQGIAQPVAASQQKKVEG
jgi:hypothetical protein